MKLLMIAPLSIGVVHGGVRMQAIKTADHLNKLGVTIHFYNPWDKTDPAAYDLIHIFLAGNETLTMARLLSNMSCKLAVSPVFYTRRSAPVIRQAINMQSIANKLFKGIFSDYSIKASVCKSADIVLPNTQSEADLIRDGFEITGDRIHVIPNGVDADFADSSPDLFESTYHVRNFTLFVGDASARRKNLLNLLQRHTTSDHPLVIIGKFDRSSYSQRCLEIINNRENVLYMGQVAHEDPMLASAYAAASVFTLPSLFETPGIAALEAALAGCRIAITNVGGTQEIFGNHADYIDPENSSTIMQAIRAAHAKSEDDALKKDIMQNYIWEIVANKTFTVYKTLIL